MEKTRTRSTLFATAASHQDHQEGENNDNDKENDSVAMSPTIAMMTTTQLDRNCAIFVRDALFPLRRDWGTTATTTTKNSSNNNGGPHNRIHPALYALDRLRTDLITKRNSTMSFSGIFPRGVIVVPNKTNSINSSGSGSSSIEWNGQPTIVDSSVEIIPNLLTVKCIRCDSNVDNAYKKYIHNNNNRSRAFMRTIPESVTTGQRTQQRHELVVCSDRVLQKDYYNQFGGILEGEKQQQRRNDMPIQSLMAVEETLVREITKLQVNNEKEEEMNQNVQRNSSGSVSNSVLSYPSLFSFSSSTSSSSSSSSNAPTELPTEASSSLSSSSLCDEYALFEIMAAKAAECMLLRERGGKVGVNKQHDNNSIHVVRMGSSLRPSSNYVFSLLPLQIQNNFTNRCIQSVAIKYTTDAIANADNNNDNTTTTIIGSNNVNNNNDSKPTSPSDQSFINIDPKKCVHRAWKKSQSQ